MKTQSRQQNTEDNMTADFDRNTSDLGQSKSGKIFSRKKVKVQKSQKSKSVVKFGSGVNNDFMINLQQNNPNGPDTRLKFLPTT